MSPRESTLGRLGEPVPAPVPTRATPGTAFSTLGFLDEFHRHQGLLSKERGLRNRD